MNENIRKRKAPQGGQAARGLEGQKLRVAGADPDQPEAGAVGFSVHLCIL